MIAMMMIYDCLLLAFILHKKYRYIIFRRKTNIPYLTNDFLLFFFCLYVFIFNITEYWLKEREKTAKFRTLFQCYTESEKSEIIFWLVNSFADPDPYGHFLDPRSA